jgi:N-glycosylase/DNA lyase
MSISATTDRLPSPMTVPTNPLCLRQTAAVLAREAALTSSTVKEGWREMSENVLWTVLASCILGSQVSNTQLRTAIANLSNDGLAEPWQHTAGIDELKQLMWTSLSGLSDTSHEVGHTGYRFPWRGATMLAGAVTELYGNGSGIRQLIAGSSDCSSLRRLLVARIPGIGPKQASLFLLETGVSDDVASLDRHLMRYIWLTRSTARTGNASSPRPPSGISAYERMESDLREEATGIGVSLAAFDLALWVLMRVWSASTRPIGLRAALGSA